MRSREGEEEKGWGRVREEMRGEALVVALLVERADEDVVTATSRHLFPAIPVIIGLIPFEGDGIGERLVVAHVVVKRELVVVVQRHALPVLGIRRPPHH